MSIMRQPSERKSSESETQAATLSTLRWEEHDDYNCINCEQWWQLTWRNCYFIHSRYVRICWVTGPYNSIGAATRAKRVKNSSRNELVDKSGVAGEKITFCCACRSISSVDEVHELLGQRMRPNELSHWSLQKCSCCKCSVWFFACF